MYRRIMVCTDGSELATLAARHAVGLARVLGARLLAIHVTPPFHPPEGFEDSPLMPAITRYVSATRAAARRHLGAVARRAERAGVRCETRHVGGPAPAHQIVETATREKSDLIVMGSHGRDRIARIMLGSVTSRVLETCAIPVLVVRPPREAARKRVATAAKRASSRRAGGD